MDAILPLPVFVPAPASDNLPSLNESLGATNAGDFAALLMLLLPTVGTPDGTMAPASPRVVPTDEFTAETLLTDESGDELQALAACIHVPLVEMRTSSPEPWAPSLVPDQGGPVGVEVDVHSIADPLSTAEPSNPRAQMEGGRPEMNPVVSGLKDAFAPPELPEAKKSAAHAPSATQGPFPLSKSLARALEDAPTPAISPGDNPVIPARPAVMPENLPIAGKVAPSRHEPVPLPRQTIERDEQSPLFHPASEATVVPRAPSEPPRTPAAAPLSPLEQIEPHVRASLGTLRQTGQAELLMDLHPPELGHVRLHLAVEDDGLVHVRIVVHTDGAQRVIDQQLDPLRARLEEMGVSVGQFDVRRDGGSPDHPARRETDPSAKTTQTAMNVRLRLQKTYVQIVNPLALVDVIA
jgi:hypothetical protein